MRPANPATAARSASSRLHSATMAASATAEARQDFVAATLRSTPAPIGITASAPSASGEASWLTTAIEKAPASRAAACRATMSGLWPDCETETTTAFFNLSGAP